ncbi:MAG: PIN domain-containing protein [Streptosporangiales bacterium]|nr:PIN domain-containing protein [Streptosporangiales bacterium]
MGACGRADSPARAARSGSDEPPLRAAGDPVRVDRRSPVTAPWRAVADTSVLIGLEGGRVAVEDFAEYSWAVSTVTLGELRLGVIQAVDPLVASHRLATYQLAQQFDPLVIDEDVADSWAVLVARLRAEGRKMPINDSWIAATALAHDVPLVTQDADYDHAPGLTVIKL